MDYVKFQTNIIIIVANVRALKKFIKDVYRTRCPPKKAERWVFSSLRAKMPYFLTSLLNKASSTEENDTKIIKFV